MKDNLKCFMLTTDKQKSDGRTGTFRKEDFLTAYTPESKAEWIKAISYCIHSHKHSIENNPFIKPPHRREVAPIAPDADTEDERILVEKSNNISNVVSTFVQSWIDGSPFDDLIHPGMNLYVFLKLCFFFSWICIVSALY